jgi:hypothetical protein
MIGCNDAVTVREGAVIEGRQGGEGWRRRALAREEK